MEKRLKDVCASCSKIHFIDFQNQSMMPVVYRLCDVFVLPSAGPGETWGLSVNEAMACGKAVLVSDKAGCAINLVDPGSNGYVFAANNQQDLQDKLRLFTNIAEAFEMGERSLEIIKDYNLKTVAAAIEEAVGIETEDDN